jgi:hypothetical protein
MKYLNSHVLELRRIAGFLATFVLATASEAALYTTGVSTPYAVQSWTDVDWQPGATTPTAGNTYEILWGGRVQNPPGDAPVFPGDALTLDRGARLQLKGTSPVTLSFPGVDGNAGLILNGGRLQAGDDNTFTIDGQIAVAANSLIDLGLGSRSLVITAQLSGEGNLTLFSWNPANSMDIQSTNNPYSGDWLVVRGYLKGTGVNSLGAGNLTIGNGTLEISYDIQTSGTLTLLGSNGVMVLHQDCQFSAVTINGTQLEPGTYSYAALVAQFPDNFTQGGSGGITVASPIPVPESLSATSDTTANVASVPAVGGSINATVMAIIDTTAPTTPSGLTALVNSSSQITLSWNPTTDVGGSGLAGYEVHRGAVILGTTTGTTYTDSGLTAGSLHCYRIMAYDNAGNTSASTLVCATTTGDTTVPAAPSGLTALVNSSSQITLSWNPTTDFGGSGLAGYEVHRGAVILGTTTGTTYTDSGLTAGSLHCYRIMAYDNAGNTSASTLVCTTTLGSAAPLVVTNQVFNEWYGPFVSWTNVMAWGARCDGVTDDSVAVSNALAAVGNGTCSPVLLIPGMCRVTKKPWLAQRHGIAVVGLNRDTCGFLYDGPTVSASDANNSGAATCFHVDGVVNSYFARLKFDGNFKARTVLASSQQSFAIFDNNNLYEDCIIKNSAPGGIGIDGGHFEPWEGFSNEDFVRCLIQTNSIGVELENFNALDIWFTDCLIENNTTYGIYVSKGDAHAYHSFFQHNGIDFYHLPGAVFCSMVSNTSYQSGAFFVTVNQGANTTPLLFKGNTVIDPAGIPYQMNQFGPVVMLDNSTLTTNATISFATGSIADLLAVGNTNGISNWAKFSGAISVRSNLVDNVVVSRTSQTFTLPGLPVAATNLNRTVFEMTTSMTSASLQSSINSAGDGSVFHIPSPVLELNHQIYPTSTVTIPANKDVRIVGDGPNTILFWSGSSGGTLFSCPSPSRATFSHIGLIGNYGGAANLINVSGVGSTPARVYLRDSSGTEPVGANLFLGNCPNTVIDVTGLSYGGGNTPGTPATSGANVVLSGAGKVRYINTDGGGNAISFVCTNGGQLYVENSYNEASNSSGNKLLRVSGNGTITFLGSKMVENIGGAEDFSRATSDGFDVANFTGQLSILGIQVIDWFNISGSTTGSVWIQGANTFRNPVSTWPIINATGNLPVQTMNYNYADASGSTRIPDIGTASAAFTRQMLSQARMEYTDRAPMQRRANQTDVLLEQVFFELGTKNLSVTP